MSVCILVYGLLSVCLYMSLSVLVFILVYSMYYPVSFLLTVRTTACIRQWVTVYFLLLLCITHAVYIMAVLLSVFLHAYYTQLNSLIVCSSVYRKDEMNDYSFNFK